MTIKERMAELLEHGCVITLLWPDAEQWTPPMELILGGVLWMDKPPRLRWCAIFPEDQQHFHELRYDRVVFDNDGRDILFYQGGKLAVTVVPYEEGGLDVAAVAAALVRWRPVAAEMDFEAALGDPTG